MAKRDSAWRMKIAASMQGNTNATRSRFSEDLEAQYGDDPDTLAWIRENQKQLDSPSSDGSVPYSDDQIKTGDSKFTYLE